MLNGIGSAQKEQKKIEQASWHASFWNPKTTGSTENLREKAAEMTDENEDSEEPA